MLTSQIIYFVAFFLFGFISFAVQLYLLNGRSPQLYANPFCSGIWMSGLITVFSISGYVELIKFNSAHKSNNNKSALIFFYYIIISIFTVVLSLSYFIGNRIEPAILAAILTTELAIVAYTEYVFVMLASAVATRESQHATNTQTVYYALVDEEDAISLPARMSPMSVDATKQIDTYELSYDCGNQNCRFKPPKVPSLINCFIYVILFILYIFLLNGCLKQTMGYRRYTPNGQFVSITYPDGNQQTILAECVGPKNTSLPTFWMEVGGGGHSMSDLWGLRDVLSQKYGRRYCSYDMPGTAWSGFIRTTQPIITEQVMQAVGEEGPFIMMGNMDYGDERAYQFALDHPDRVLAVVPVGFGPTTEMQGLANFYNWTYDEQVEKSKATQYRRMQTGNFVNFFLVSFGIADYFFKVGDYQPSDRGYESHFLNLYNEKQWTTENTILRQASVSGSFTGYTLWYRNTSLSPDIPVYGFNLFRTDEEIYQGCEAAGYLRNSSQCQYNLYSYHTEINFDEEVCQRNKNGGRLILAHNCSQCMGSGFFVDQYDHIDWFAEALIEATGHTIVTGAAD